MRIFLLILLVISAPALAEDNEQTFFEYLKGLGKSDCQAFLDNGDAVINASKKAAGNKDWDEAFYYDEQAFHTFLKAYGHCDEEPENKQKASERLDHSKAYGDYLACVYHTTEAESAYQRSTLALEHLESASIALKHAQHSLQIVTTDATRFCSVDEDRTEYIKRLESSLIETVGILQAHIDEYGEDGIEVP